MRSEISTVGGLSIKLAWLVGTLVLTAGVATASEDGKYPDLRGQWRGVLRTVTVFKGQPSFDPSKSWGRLQEAPLTPEYQAIMEASIRDQEDGGFGNHRGGSCLGFGMPIIAYGFEPQEFIVTPDTTYILVNWVEHTRRIFTDGREWPVDSEPTLTGYSIGRWIDHDSDGHYDVLEVETRGPFKGPRDYDATGLPLHRDNQSIFKERIYLDKADKDLMHNEITVIDHALTRPWTITRDYRRNQNPRPNWNEFICAENNPYVTIENETYFLSGDGLLMPAKKGQRPPDLRFFKDSRK